MNKQVPAAISIILLIIILALLPFISLINGQQSKGITIILILISFPAIMLVIATSLVGIMEFYKGLGSILLLCIPYFIDSFWINLLLLFGGLGLSRIGLNLDKIIWKELRNCKLIKSINILKRFPQIIEWPALLAIIYYLFLPATLGIIFSMTWGDTTEGILALYIGSIICIPWLISLSKLLISAFPDNINKHDITDLSNKYDCILTKVLSNYKLEHYYQEITSDYLYDGGEFLLLNSKISGIRHYIAKRERYKLFYLIPYTRKKPIALIKPEAYFGKSLKPSAFLTYGKMIIYYCSSEYNLILEEVGNSISSKIGETVKLKLEKQNL